MAGFTHLHCHSEYSLLDGLARVPDLVSTAKERGFDALALTDHGVMFGAVQFYEHAVKAGIKPILGCEIYVAKRGRGDRDSKIDRKPYHLTVLAENQQGYRNLMALISHAQLEGFYYRPRADRELLERYNEGLVVFSGCPGSEVANHIIEGRMDGAREAANWYRTVFKGRYYIELMVHDIEFIPRLNVGLLQLAKELDLPTVATNDVHYCRDTDVSAHEVLLCVQTGKTMLDPDRMKIGDTFYLRTEAEMRHLFREMEDAVDRTAEVAERCDVTLTFNEYKLPLFDVPDGETAATFLRKQCEKGIAERYPTITEEVRTRLEYELSVIGQMGFDAYFLIVWDLCVFAAERGIWWNVRGSGAASIVAYSLRITNIDPLHHKLIFERFLNPSRVSMPDIDLDFPDDQRDLLIRYTFEKYGHDKVAQIITFGTMGARASVRDAGRALAMPLVDVDRIARMIPAIPGKSCSIADALRPSEGTEVNEFFSHDLASAYDLDPESKRLLDNAQRIEGVARHASTHAAGVVITDRPLVDYVPLHRPTRGAGDEDDITTTLAVTQYNMNDVEKLGLLKVDFLGLATLTVLRRAAELVERYHGKRYTLDTIPLDDPAIYELLSSGHVTGVFQVEGAGMRRMLREMRPQRFENVVAAIALYRPGPMEYIPTYIQRLHGKERVVFRHPSLEPILAETYGIIVYQEQIIQIARDLAGYDAGEADMIRKAVAKKIEKKLLLHRKKFVKGAVANGIPEHAAERTFEDIETFARYGFNKAHAADYAVIVCQTAYLKAHYPVEYAAALLAVERDDTEKIAIIAADCHRMGIELRQPDINRSELNFTIEAAQKDVEDGDRRKDEDKNEPNTPHDPAPTEPDGAAVPGRSVPALQHRRGIRFGLAAIKNVGTGHVETLIEAREEGGPFRDLEDLANRVDLRLVGKRALESLVKAGALDHFGGRATLLAALERVVQLSTSHYKAAEVGQMSLFGDAMPDSQASMLYPLPEAIGNPKEELLWEKELIGLYLSDHPLQRAAASLHAVVTHLTGDLDPDLNGQPATMAGIVTSVRSITTKKGAPMAFVRLEDLQGDLELIVFPRTYEATRAVWGVDRVVVVQGKIEHREDRVQLIVDRAELHDPEHPGIIAAAAAAAAAAVIEAPTPPLGPVATEVALPFAHPTSEAPPAWAVAHAEREEDEAPLQRPTPSPMQEPPVTTQAPAASAIDQPPRANPVFEPDEIEPHMSAPNAIDPLVDDRVAVDPLPLETPAAALSEGDRRASAPSTTDPTEVDVPAAAAPTDDAGDPAIHAAEPAATEPAAAEAPTARATEPSADRPAASTSPSPLAGNASPNAPSTQTATAPSSTPLHSPSKPSTRRRAPAPSSRGWAGQPDVPLRNPVETPDVADPVNEETTATAIDRNVTTNADVAIDADPGNDATALPADPRPDDTAALAPDPVDTNGSATNGADTVRVDSPPDVGTHPNPVEVENPAAIPAASSPAIPVAIPAEVAATDPAAADNGVAPTTSGGAVLRQGPDAPRYVLAVTLPRRDTQDEAIALLGEVFQTLIDYDGADTFSLIVPNGPELVELDFPNHATCYCVDLLGKLKGIVGEERIRVRATVSA